MAYNCSADRFVSFRLFFFLYKQASDQRCRKQHISIDLIEIESPRMINSLLIFLKHAQYIPHMRGTDTVLPESWHSISNITINEVSRNLDCRVDDVRFVRNASCANQLFIYDFLEHSSLL